MNTRNKNNRQTIEKNETNPEALPADVADVVLLDRVALVGVHSSEVHPELARVRYHLGTLNSAQKSIYCRHFILNSISIPISYDLGLCFLSFFCFSLLAFESTAPYRCNNFFCNYALGYKWGYDPEQLRYKENKIRSTNTDFLTFCITANTDVLSSSMDTFICQSII